LKKLRPRIHGEGSGSVIVTPIGHHGGEHVRMIFAVSGFMMPSSKNTSPMTVSLCVRSASHISFGEKSAKNVHWTPP
jgi:hypothetical protein